MLAMASNAIERTEGFWLGRWGAVAGEAVRMIEQKDQNGAKRYLQSTLAEFIASPVPAEETRALLRPYLGGKK
jgi:hypothetical protein